MIFCVLFVSSFLSKKNLIYLIYITVQIIQSDENLFYVSTKFANTSKKNVNLLHTLR